jgi:clan AA aspartic protease (TIGR02281 family)
MMKNFLVLLCLLLLVSVAGNLYLYGQLTTSKLGPAALQNQDANSFETHYSTAPAIQGSDDASNGTPLSNSNAPYATTRYQANSEAAQSRETWLRQANTWLQQEKYARLSRFLQDYLKSHPQDIDFLLLEADLVAQTSLLSEAIIHYYSLLKLPMMGEQYQHIQDTITSLSTNTISQLEKAYSWDILAIFVEPLLQIDPNNKLFIVALAQAYAEQQQANLMENTLASLPFDDPDALAIRDIIQIVETVQNTNKPDNNEDPSLTSTERAIPLNQYGDQYVVGAQLGGNNVDLLIDTGATITAIDRDHYRQLNKRFKINYLGRFKVNTANGSLMAPMYQFRELQIGHRKVENIAVVILPMGGLANADGLLGMNFLREFDFRIDQRKALLYLKK